MSTFLNLFPKITDVSYSPWLLQKSFAHPNLYLHIFTNVKCIQLKLDLLVQNVIRKKFKRRSYREN
jgi:hypothetical protein